MAILKRPVARWRQWVLAAALLAAIAPGQAGGQTSMPATNPTTTTATSSQVITLIRWDVLLNEDGMVPVDALDRQPVETKSTLYHAAICDAGALRGAVMAAKGLGGIEGANADLAMSGVQGDGRSDMSRHLYFDYSNGQKIRLQGGVDGLEHVDSPDETHIHLKLATSRISAHLYDVAARKQAPVEKEKPSIIFDGSLTPGQALMFLATIHNGTTPYYHLVAWEAFKSYQRYQENFLMIGSSDAWCALGPETINSAADVAFVWEFKSKHDPDEAPPKWERKLEDGKTLKLLGIARSDKYLFCAWDGDGQPIPGGNHVPIGPSNTIYCRVQVTAAADELRKQIPTGKPMDDRQMERYNAQQILETSDGKLKVGVPVGDWQKVGPIQAGASMKIDGKTYRMRPPQGAGGNRVYVQFGPTSTGGETTQVVTLTAVGSDGIEHDSIYMIPVLGGPSETYPLVFDNLAQADVKSFNAWKRKVQWITLEGFATEPAVPPPAHVDAAELAKALQGRDPTVSR